MGCTCVHSLTTTCRWPLRCNWGDHSLGKLTLLFSQCTMLYLPWIIWRQLFLTPFLHSSMEEHGFICTLSVGIIISTTAIFLLLCRVKEGDSSFKLDRDIPKMTTFSVNHWLQKFVLEVRKMNRDYYCPDSLHQMCCGLQRALRAANWQQWVCTISWCARWQIEATECHWQLHA